MENIKHVSDAKNVCFVLVTNAAQLEKVVDGQYVVTEAAAYIPKTYLAKVGIPVAGISEDT